MGHPKTMRPLNFLLLAGFLAQANSLECFKCEPALNCTQRIIRCQDGQNWCTTRLSQWGDVNDTHRTVLKGCAWREGANETVSFTSGMVRNVQSDYFCDTNLCNQEDPAEVPVSMEPNGFQCHACNSPITSCNKTHVTVENCTGLENQCVSSSSSYLLSEDKVTKMSFINEGCFYHPSCTAPLGYSTGHISSLFECCNSSLCNNATRDFLNKIQTPNGVKCYSCEGVHASGCSPRNEAMIECFGPLSMCMEVAVYDERRNVTVAIKGCATPAWCQHPSYHQFLTADFRRVHCCQGNLCNGQEFNAAARATRRPKLDYTIHSNGGLPLASIPQFTAALLLISTSWSLMTFPGF